MKYKQVRERYNMQVIGFCGAISAGKTTSATLVRHILTEQGKRVLILPFAKALKDLAMQIGWNGIKDDKGRRLLQLLGTDVCRECISENYWIEKWQANVQDIESFYDTILCDDVRFPNEADTILASPSNLLIRIERPNQCKNQESECHASEQHFKNFKVTHLILNDGTIPQLRTLLEGIHA